MRGPILRTSSAHPPRPSRSDLAAAARLRRPVRDVVGPGLSVLFVGINPGLYSAATGLHFARPGNRFWPALHRSGFTPRLLAPWESSALPGLGVGLTLLVHRPTATAEELTPAELRAGGARVRRMVRRLRPGTVCFLGVGAYRGAYSVSRVRIGMQGDGFEGSALWVLPNPSGLNANYQLADFVRLFGRLRRTAAGHSGREVRKPRSG